LFDDTQRVQIVIEAAAVRAHQFVQLAFAGMAKRRMADVVNESERFASSVFSSSAPATVRAICATRSMRQAIAKMVRVARG